MHIQVRLNTELLDALSRGAPEIAEIACLTVARRAAREARRRAPVGETGVLRRSMRAGKLRKPGRRGAWVAARAPYAWYVEFGRRSRPMPEQPFFVPAVEAAGAELVDEIAIQWEYFGHRIGWMPEETVIGSGWREIGS